jgi:hypothetical protein
MTRTSNNQYGPSGALLNGFDYDVQVWVKNGIVQNCGHIGQQSEPCCNARRYAGLRLTQAFAHEADRRNPQPADTLQPLFSFDRADGTRVSVAIEPVRDDTNVHLRTAEGVVVIPWSESDLAQALLAFWNGDVKLEGMRS